MFQEILLKALDKSDKGYACLQAQHSPNADLTFHVLKASSAFWKLTGIGGGKQQNIVDSVCPELHALLKNYLACKETNSSTKELQIQRLDRWLRVEIICADDDYLVVILSDMTREIGERNTSEKFQNQYKMIFENSQLGIFRYDESGVIKEVNDAFIDILGSSREKILGLNTTMLSDSRMSNAISSSLKGNRERVFGKYKAVTSGKDVDVNCFFSPIIDNGIVTGGFGIVRDVTERLRIQRELEENESNLNYAQQLANMGSWESSPEGKQLYWSENYYRLLGLEPFSVVPDDDLFFSKVHPDDRYKFKLDEPHVKSKPDTRQFEFRVLVDGGQVRWLKNSIDYIYDGDKLVHLKGINIDITELKNVQIQLEKSLKEKDTLLSEVHHRVKNNLAIVSSLLQLQSDNLDTEPARTVLIDSVSRVRSMALIHELIYRQESFSSLKFDEFLREFVDFAHDNYSNEKVLIRTDVQVGQVQLDIDRAIPLSLITNELLSNAYKHAFRQKNDGLIEIKLKSDERDILLSVTDNGVGIPETFSAQNGSTLGASLISGLVEQLNGSVEFEKRTAGGTSILVRIPIDHRFE